MNIVITGASEGIGRAVAMALASKASALHLSARSIQKLELLKATLKGSYPTLKVFILSVDLSQRADINTLSKDVLTKLPQVDVLVNNVGQFTAKHFLDTEELFLEKMIDINLYSAYYLTQALLPSMLERAQGHIINMCSIASLKAYPASIAYGISKYALYGFTTNLREVLQSKGIKVSAVFPGATQTKSWEGVAVEAHRLMMPEDVALMVAALVSLSPQAVVEDLVLRPQLGDL